MAQNTGITNTTAARNPGGWPTGPLEADRYYARRDACNALADLRDVIFNEIRPLADWLAARLERRQ